MPETAQAIHSLLYDKKRMLQATPPIEKLWEEIHAYATEKGWSVVFLVHMSATTYALSFHYFTTDTRGRRTLTHDHVTFTHRSRTLFFRTATPFPELNTNGNIVKYYRPIPLATVDDLISVVALQAKTDKEIWVAKQLTGAFHLSNAHYQQRQQDLKQRYQTEAKQQQRALQEAKRIQKEKQAKEKQAKAEAKRIQAYEKRKAKVLHHWQHRKSEKYQTKRADARAKRAFKRIAKEVRETIHEQQKRERREEVLHHWYHRKTPYYRKQRKSNREARSEIRKAKETMQAWLETFQQQYAAELANIHSLKEHYFQHRPKPDFETPFI